MAKLGLIAPEGTIVTQIAWLDNGTVVNTIYPAQEGSLERRETVVFESPEALSRYILSLAGAKVD